MAATVLFTPLGTDPPKAWTLPKERFAEPIPNPPRVIPEGSVVKVISKLICASARHEMSKVNIIEIRKIDLSKLITLSQFAVATKLIVLLIAPALAENGIVKLSVYAVVP